MRVREESEKIGSCLIQLQITAVDHIASLLLLLYKGRWETERKNQRGYNEVKRKSNNLKHECEWNGLTHKTKNIAGKIRNDTYLIHI